MDPLDHHRSSTLILCVLFHIIPLTLLDAYRTCFRSHSGSLYCVGWVAEAEGIKKRKKENPTDKVGFLLISVFLLFFPQEHIEFAILHNEDYINVCN